MASTAASSSSTFYTNLKELILRSNEIATVGAIFNFRWDVKVLGLSSELERKGKEIGQLTKELTLRAGNTLVAEYNRTGLI
ncbi:hypothetical protein Ahy_B07g086750 isoform A [Arachis hypogaea]|uniref:Uncharacterized protein n=1 Tax=Arachis hypogaea TaxID=3818 RepID=A0A444YAD6_ARAHY|nr:hypothetical protein Ahy_B07g086750 isoform A [Arachis hypogaea]